MRGAGAPLLLPSSCGTAGERGTSAKPEGTPHLLQAVFSLGRTIALSLSDPAFGRGLAALRCSPCLAASSGCASGGALRRDPAARSAKRGGSWAEGASKRAEGGALSDPEHMSVLRTQLHSWRCYAPQSSPCRCAIGWLRVPSTTDLCRFRLWHPVLVEQFTGFQHGAGYADQAAANRP